MVHGQDIRSIIAYSPPPRYITVFVQGPFYGILRIWVLRGKRPRLFFCNMCLILCIRKVHFSYIMKKWWSSRRVITVIVFEKQSRLYRYIKFIQLSFSIIDKLETTSRQQSNRMNFLSLDNYRFNLIAFFFVTYCLLAFKVF
jgi:hypothetical protein